MIFLCYPKCSTCKKAQAFLDTNGVSYTLRDIAKDNPTAAELALWQEMSGLALKRFFNTSGLQYRALGLSAKLPDMTDAQQLELLSADGMLVKRPLLITEDRVLVGFKESEWAQLLTQ